MRWNEIPAPLPFIFNSTSDFCSDRCRTIALRFPLKQNLPSLTAPSHQWLTVSNYDVNSRPPPCLRSFRPIEHRRAIITGFTPVSLCEPSLRVDFYIMPNRDAPVILEDRDLEQNNPEVELANVTSVLIRAPLCCSVILLKGQRRNEQRYNYHCDN